MTAKYPITEHRALNYTSQYLLSLMDCIVKGFWEDFCDLKSCVPILKVILVGIENNRNISCANMDTFFVLSTTDKTIRTTLQQNKNKFKINLLRYGIDKMYTEDSLLYKH